MRGYPGYLKETHSLSLSRLLIKISLRVGLTCLKILALVHTYIYINADEIFYILYYIARKNLYFGVYFFKILGNVKKY